MLTIMFFGVSETLFLNFSKHYIVRIKLIKKSVNFHDQNIQQVVLPYYLVCMVFYLLFTALHYLLYNAKPRMSMER